MSSLAFLVTELQVCVRWDPSRSGCSNRYSLCPVRRNEGTQKLERCLWSFPSHQFPHSRHSKAAEKSLAILRASPEQATANLASGMILKLSPCAFLHPHDRWTTVRRPSPPRFHGMRDEEYEGRRNIARLPPSPYIAQSSPPVGGPHHCQHYGRLH